MTVLMRVAYVRPGREGMSGVESPRASKQCFEEPSSKESALTLVVAILIVIYGVVLT